MKEKKYPDQLTWGTRVYLPMRAAAELIRYDKKTIVYWMKVHPDRFRSLWFEDRQYLLVSDLVAYAAARQKQKTKLQQIADWWAIHPDEREQLASSIDFQRRLARSGIMCSAALCRHFWTKWVQHTRTTVRDEIIACLVALPALKTLPKEKLRKALSGRLNRSIVMSTLDRTLAYYERTHDYV